MEKSTYVPRDKPLLDSLKITRLGSPRLDIFYFKQDVAALKCSRDCVMVIALRVQRVSMMSSLLMANTGRRDRSLVLCR
jgi:hypothetical protein